MWYRNRYNNICCAIPPWLNLSSVSKLKLATKLFKESLSLEMNIWNSRKLEFLHVCLNETKNLSNGMTNRFYSSREFDTEGENSSKNIYLYKI